MKLHYELGACQINKHGEELCGDTINYNVSDGCATLVVCDGLGSGVKANILSTLTAKIATHMIAEGMTIETVVETITETLPVCQVRKLAYSTLALARLLPDGRVSLTEFDSPHAFVLHNRRLRNLNYDTRTIAERKIQLAEVSLRTGDWLIIVSDGVLNAGIGAASDLGWDWNDIATYLQNHAHPRLSAEGLARKLAETCQRLYEDRCGDDVSVAVIKTRERRFATILTGPPLDKKDDAKVVRRLLTARGQRIVCGGTTANLVARALDTTVAPDLSTMAEDVPPTGTLEGVDLVTEGVLTLSKTLQMLRAGTRPAEIRFKIDGASALTRALRHADEIAFIVGRALNPAHQNPSLPAALGLKGHIVREIAAELEKQGKTVTIEEH